MADFITRIEAIGIHSRFDIRHEFQSGINIIYGGNGKGKTTLLHILSNVLNSDYRLFFHLDFHSIKVYFNDGCSVGIMKKSSSIYIKKSTKRRTLRIFPDDMDSDHKIAISPSIRNSILPVSYFPAFRTMLDAWTLLEYETQSSDQNFTKINLAAKSTNFARKLFGQFVPWLDYLSLHEIEQKIYEELRSALLSIANLDREVLSKSLTGIIKAFAPNQSVSSVNVGNEPREILDEINNLSLQINNHPLQIGSLLTREIYLELQELLETVDIESEGLKNVVVSSLSVYRDIFTTLAEAQERSYYQIKSYLETINSFFDDKKIELNITRDLNAPIISIRFENEEVLNSFYSLSSGEQQIVTLIYAAHMSQREVILIDEPEISLHVDWQRILLKKMSVQHQDKQIIVCTHSPIIAAEYEERLIELGISPTDKDLWEDEGFSIDQITDSMIDFDTDDKDEPKNELEQDIYDDSNEFNIVDQEIIDYDQI